MARKKYEDALHHTHDDYHRQGMLRRRYQMTLGQYDTLLRSQGNGCAICGTSPEANGSRLAVDHDHSCCPGRDSCGICVRGLLCKACNLMIGNGNDDAERLRAGADYLESYG